MCVCVGVFVVACLSDVVFVVSVFVCLCVCARLRPRSQMNRQLLNWKVFHYVPFKWELESLLRR